MLHPVTNTSKYYSCKKLSQSPQLPQLRCKNIINSNQTSHGMEQLFMDRISYARTGT